MTTSAPTTIPPTTVAPTTIAPTTMAPTTMAPTTLIPTTAGPATNISAGPITIYVTLRQSLFHYSPAPLRDSTKDQWLNLERYPLNITLSIEGETFNKVVLADPIVITLSIVGDLDIGLVLGSGFIPIVISLPAADLNISARFNFVKWSKIGFLDFTIDESNVAGERPLDWKGRVYDLLKLGDKIVAYGENGVSFLAPSGVNYSLLTVHRLGLLGRNAVAGTDAEHYFIDVVGKLYRLSAKGIELLDYSEYLSEMSSPTLSIDIENNLLYICDGTYGYILNTKLGGFGGGPINITGVGSQSGAFYVVAPDEIVTPKFEVCTDIYDLDTRKLKTIRSVEIGTDLAYKLELQIEYRISNTAEFRKSTWATVNPSGFAYLPCYGIEFRFRLKSTIYEFFEIDYLKIDGIVHGFTHLDSLTAYRQRL